jgi:hypothetical protein
MVEVSSTSFLLLVMGSFSSCCLVMNCYLFLNEIGGYAPLSKNMSWEESKYREHYVRSKMNESIGFMI